MKELAVSYPGGKFTLKLRVDGTPEQLILVQGARPVRSCVRFVLHFPFLGLLPPPIDGWSDITEMYVARLWRTETRHGGLDSHLPAH